MSDTKYHQSTILSLISYLTRLTFGYPESSKYFVKKIGLLAQLHGELETGLSENNLDNYVKGLSGLANAFRTNAYLKNEREDRCEGMYDTPFKAPRVDMDGRGEGQLIIIANAEKLDKLAELIIGKAPSDKKISLQEIVDSWKPTPVIASAPKPITIDDDTPTAMR